MASTYYSHEFGAGPPPAPVAQARAYFLELLQRGLPGPPTDDRMLQARKFAGIVYIAIQPRLKAIRKADVVAMRRRPRRGRVTFGPGGVVAKSMTAGYGKASKDDYTPLDPGHPVCRVLDRPQGDDGPETIGDVLEYLELQGCLTGEAPLWGVPSDRYLERGDYRPVQLYALPAALVYPQTAASPQYPYGSYRVTPYHAGATAGWLPGLAGGAAVAGTILDGRELRRKLHKHALYKWAGYSPLTAGQRLLDIAEAIDEARVSAFNNGSTPDLMLMLSGVEEQTALGVQQAFTNRHGGSRNHRRVAVVSSPHPEAKIDAKIPWTAPREFDFHNSWEQAISAVMALFGVTRTLIFGGGNYAENYANAVFFHQNTVQPACEELGEFLTTAVGAPWSDEPGEICIEVIPPAPRNEEVAVISAKDLSDGDVATYNQTLASQNLPPVPGGDVPKSVYLKSLEKKLGLAPEPVPPGMAPPGGKLKPKPGGTPTGGRPPAPANDEAEDTLPPIGKAMSTLNDSDGGAMVAPATVGGRKKRRRVVLRGQAAEAAVARILKGL